MERGQIARIISLFLHPSIVALPTAIFALHIYGVSFIEIAKYGILPFLTIATLLYTLQISHYKNLDMNIREERGKFYPIGITIIGITVFFIHISNGPQVIKDLSNSIIILGMTNGLINSRTKISLHTAGIGAISGLLMVVNPIYGFLSSLIVLPVGWARIVLGRHTLPQAISGFLLSFTIVYLVLTL